MTVTFLASIETALIVEETADVSGSSGSKDDLPEELKVRTPEYNTT